MTACVCDCAFVQKGTSIFSKLSLSSRLHSEAHCNYYREMVIKSKASLDLPVNGSDAIIWFNRLPVYAAWLHAYLLSCM